MIQHAQAAGFYTRGCPPQFFVQTRGNIEVIGTLTVRWETRAARVKLEAANRVSRMRVKSLYPWPKSTTPPSNWMLEGMQLLAEAVNC